MIRSRWLKNPLVWLAVGGAFLVAGALVLHANWKSQRLNELASGGEVVETRAGKVEFAREGSGPVVLVLHGAPGGYDQGLAVGRFLVDSGFEIVVPSRPGYLRTPLASGILPEQQADLMAALLDQLQISSVSVVAFGEGAASALALAAGYPEKVSRLVLLSPVLKTRSWNEVLKENRLPGGAINTALTGDLGGWGLDLMLQWDPAQALERAFQISTTLKPFDQFSEAQDAIQVPSQRQRFVELARSYLPLSDREVGTRNDQVQSLQFPTFAFSRIQVPLLVVRGEADAFTLPADVEASAKAPNRQVIRVERGGYWVMLGPGADDALKQVIEFLKTTP